MARLRWTLLLIGLGIGLPALLIVQRATSSLELENAYRHQTVAERVFDEMERSLSDFLLREEARSAADFDRVRSLGETEGSLPPGFDDADEPFLIGWFARPSGEPIPRTLSVHRRDRARLESSARLALATATRRAKASPSSDPESESAAPARGDLKLPAPGDTRSLGRKARSQDAEDTIEADAQKESTPYAVLQNLNRASSLRSERQSKALGKRDASFESYESYEQGLAASAARAEARLGAEAGATAPDAAGELADGASDSTSDRTSDRTSDSVASGASSVDSDDGASDRIARPAYARQARAGSSPTSDAFVDEFADASAGASAGVSRAARSAAERVRVLSTAAGPIVDPFTGRMTSTGEIVLTRSAWREAGVERQGLVLDRARLVDWLGGSLLRETGLAERARLEFDADADAFSDASTAGSERSAYRYVHRFAEPFDALVARLELEPLPGLVTARWIHTLAGLLVVALVIGLFAVDRMTRVVVEYAERRSDFVAAVSHELRTPLTAIRMYAEMLRDGRVASESKRAEYYATITDESERLSRLIDNVLEFSRLEQDRRSLELVVGGPGETVREAAQKLAAHAEREGFALRIDVPDPAEGVEALPRVRYDRDALTQIVFNLVDNALKYARDAERRAIEIRLVASGPGVELRVRDWGPGVPADQLERIFEPFYRIGHELTRTAEGTGIGLALVRELALGMGGSVRATRPEGGGLEIRVALAPAT